MAVGAAIERFLMQGDYDVTWTAWHGDGVAGQAVMRRVLERVLNHRASGAPLGRRAVPEGADATLVERISSAVRGLLPEHEAEAVLAVVPSLMHVVTVHGFAEQVADLPLEDAWCLANIVLEDMGAPPLSDDAPQLDGICTADAIWVPPGAFRPATAIADVLVHELAHMFHTVPRKKLGLEGNGPIWQIPVAHHETFAYACELWACRERFAPADRPDLSESVEGVRMADARVDMAKLRSILEEADQNGWPVIRAWAEALEH